MTITLYNYNITVFKHLRQTFMKALIIQYFDPKSHIKIKTYISKYAMGRVLSLLKPNSIPSPINKINLILVSGIW